MSKADEGGKQASRTRLCLHGGLPGCGGREGGQNVQSKANEARQRKYFIRYVVWNPEPLDVILHSDFESGDDSGDR